MAESEEQAPTKPTREVSVSFNGDCYDIVAFKAKTEGKQIKNVFHEIVTLWISDYYDVPESDFHDLAEYLSSGLRSLPAILRGEMTPEQLREAYRKKRVSKLAEAARRKMAEKGILEEKGDVLGSNVTGGEGNAD